MQFSVKIAATIAVLAAVAIAVPATENITLERRETVLEERGTIVVNMYGGDTCNGAIDSFSVTNGGVRCFQVPTAKQSISVSGSGCTVSTRSGLDCGGSSFRAPNGCSGVLYGSVFVQC